MSRDARARLAAAQAEVVRALVAGGPIPQGFDEKQMDIARRVLRDKQARIARARAAQESERNTETKQRQDGVMTRLLGRLLKRAT